MSSVEKYDIKLDAWVKVASLNESRHSHSSCTLGDKLYTFGGENDDRSNLFSDTIEMLNLKHAFNASCVLRWE